MCTVKQTIKILIAFLSCAFLLSCACLTRSIKDIYAESSPSVVLVTSNTGRCSGFVTSLPSLEPVVVTAGHCVDQNVSQENGSETSLESLTLVVDGVKHVFKEFEILIDDDKKDLAVIRVPGLEQLNIFPLVLSAKTPEIGERLVDIGFPYFSRGEIQFDVGYFKKVYLDETNNRIIYLADDMAFRGYSGAPVFDERGFVVGVLVMTASVIDQLNLLTHQHKDLAFIVSAKELQILISDLDLDI